MMSWGELLLPVAGIVVSALVGVGYAVWRDVRARRSLSAARAGRRVVVPVTVDGGRLARGHAVRDGADLRVITRRHHLVVDPDEVRLSGRRRERYDDHLVEHAEMTGLVDDVGDRYYVGPPKEWADTFALALEAPDRPAGMLSRLRAASPRTALGVAASAVLLGAALQTLWWSGHDVSARMVGVVSQDGVDACAVEWRDGDRRGYAELDCSQPYPKPGDRVPVRALAWPFDGSALDYEGVFAFFTLAPGLLAVGALATAGGVAARRTRRPAVRLHAPARQGSAEAALETPAEAAPETAAVLSLPGLAAAVAEREGWSDDAPGAPPTPRWWRPLTMAAASTRWWPTGVLLAAAWLPDFLAQPWRLALTAAAALALAVATARALAAYAVIRRPFGQPVTSEWSYRLVRTLEEEWVAVLLVGGTAYWAVVLGGPAHPAP
ncbi:MAG TPA: hypothetical protein VFJ94_15735, partial [Intrasporangium sp.]|uniref:hypothetical protein n=1 Tax=Intrasporangium sp. TaxID=1925024 RepID=UPI002D7A3454